MTAFTDKEEDATIEFLQNNPEIYNKEHKRYADKYHKEAAKKNSYRNFRYTSNGDFTITGTHETSFSFQQQPAVLHTVTSGIWTGREQSSQPVWIFKFIGHHRSYRCQHSTSLHCVTSNTFNFPATSATAKAVSVASHIPACFRPF